MNTFKKLTAAISLGLACSASAFASDAALDVAGTITPSACQLNIGLPGGVVDYGQIPASSLRSDQHTLVREFTFSIDAVCALPTKIALKLTDNRSGSADGMGFYAPYNYGLGLTPTGVKTGAYMTLIGNELVDGNPSHLISQSGGGSWALEANGLFSHDQLFSWTQDTSVVAPQSLTVLHADVSLQAVIAGHNGMTFENDIPLDGSAVMELVYL